MLMGIFGAILPRFVLLVGWVNDPNAWTSLFGAPVWFLFGFLFFPWTTLIYGFVVQNGMSLINWIFVGAALLIDLGTWGIGAFASRQQVSNYHGTGPSSRLDAETDDPVGCVGSADPDVAIGHGHGDGARDHDGA
jgi:hypothetical protein